MVGSHKHGEAVWGAIRGLPDAGICVLLLSHRYRRDLFEKGHIFVAVPPLYKLEYSGPPLLALSLTGGGDDSAAAASPTAKSSSSGRQKKKALDPEGEDDGPDGRDDSVGGKGSGGGRSGARNVLWCFTEAQKQDAVGKIPQGVTYSLQRFKGLGECRMMQ